MNTRIRYVAYSLAGISIALTLLLAFPEANRSRAKAPSNARAAESRTGTIVEGGTATLAPANLKTWNHSYSWYHPERPYCGAPFKRADSAEEIPGSITAGYWHRYDSGALVFSCPDGVNSVSRGTLWFDLSEIMSKAPPLHASVQTATLHFKQLPVPPISPSISKATGDCPGELLVGTADWLTGYADNTLVPGDPIASLGSCGPAGCDFNVTTVVNNWLKGAEHG